jgi:hypothetical protein
MMSKPIKISQRKDETYYVQFEGLRYTINISGDRFQRVDRKADNDKRQKLIEKAKNYYF